jgi:dTDP-glucose 4,6-dehydratase
VKYSNVLITGAGGFVGSHLAELLVDAGCQVRCFTRYTSRPQYGWLDSLPLEKRKALEIVAGDLRDADAIDHVVKGCETVFHLGALIGIPYSYKHPREVVETNLMGTLNILTSALKHGGCRVVFTSTSEVYGTANYAPIDENHLLQAQSPYAASKIAAEKLVESFHSTYALPTVILRPFNIYGPRQSARAVIPTIITQIITQSQVKLGHVHVTRDFTYIGDTVRAFRQAAESEEAIGKVINIGSNTEVSIAELVAVIAELLHCTPNIVQEQARLRPEASEVQRLWADNRKAYELINWAPSVPLSQGLQHTINWIEANLDRYRIGTYEI